MKVTFPKNIRKWFLSGFSFNIWPFSVSIIQLIIVAMWVWLALAAFNAGQKAGSKVAWTVMAVIIVVIVLFVTFFKVSEMNVIQFTAKKIKENFFDVTKKFQSNSEKLDWIEVALKEWEIKDQQAKTQVVEQKKEPEVEEIFEKIKNDELV